MERQVSWNSRGLNKPQKRLRIRNLLFQQKIGLFGLLETKIKASSLGALYLNVCPHWRVTFNLSICKGGRIVVGWHPSIFSVDILAMTSQLIHLKAELVGSHKSFNCTYVYGFNEAAERVALWKDLQSIANRITLPWIVLGDFNNVLHFNERIGAPIREKEVKPMRTCFTYCGLTDLKSIGHFYTWNNKQQSGSRVYTKIDRAVGNNMCFFLTRKRT